MIPVDLAVTTLVWFYFFPREAAGATGTRHSPRPRFLSGETIMHRSGKIAPRGRGGVFWKCGCFILALVARKSAFSYPSPSCGEGGHIVSEASDVTGGGLLRHARNDPTRRFAPPQSELCSSRPTSGGIRKREAVIAKSERERRNPLLLLPPWIASPKAFAATPNRLDIAVHNLWGRDELSVIVFAVANRALQA